MGVKFRKDREKWQGCVVLNGKLTRRLFKTKRDAEIFVHESKEQRRMSGIQRESTISGAFTSYLETESAQKTRSSAESDKRLLMLAEIYFSRILPSKEISEIKLEHLQKFQLWLTQDTEFKKPWSATTIAKGCKVLKSVFRKLEMTDQIVKNPCRFWRIPRGQKKVRRPMTQGEFAKIYSIAPDWYRPILLTLRFTGARGASIADLKWADVDFSNARLSLSSRKGGRDQMKTIIIPLFPELMDVFARQRNLDIRADYRDHGYVFVGENWAPVNAKLISRIGFKLIRQAGLTGVVLYGLRHALATDLLEAGVSTDTARRLMGHSDDSQLKEYTSTLGIQHLETALISIRGRKKE